ncbi:PLP-dependent aminotransferase family protein [Bosea sp. 117]|uniref:MocR-like pyridoxine biosynthesis transcription factor PdxR n=1 Tax=Bosea sp. 117 TaxID=1125973 RepID=UPI00068FE58E|nr:PLP-dependent aminotransferase family protein [Bosea sp. 117]
MPKTAITGSLVAVEFDKSSDVPIYRQITEAMKSAILSGRLAVGSKLPSTRIFANELGVSRNTIVQVFEVLTEEGLLASRVGAGTFVVDAAPRRDAMSAPTMTEDQPNGSYPFRSLSRRGKSLVVSSTGEFSERPTPFMPDLPDLREFPIRTWLRLLNETSGRLTGQILAEASSAGYEPLRRAVAQHLSASRGVVCSYEQVIITTGSQQGLDLVCRMLLDAGDPVWLEEPSYVGTRSVIRANGGVVCPVPVDERGGRFDEAISLHPAPRLIFTSPARHYPLGSQLAPERRDALVAIASRCGSWILEDDYDHEFIYDPNLAMRSLHAQDGDQRTIHMGTFSKTLLPSFRLGYLVVPADLGEHFAKARAVVDRHASLIEQMVLSEFMNRGLFVSHIRRMRNLYHSRRTQLVTGLEDIFGRDCCRPMTLGGTHVILPLAETARDQVVARRAAERGLVLRPLSPYYMTGSRAQGLLVGFSAFNSHEIARGLEVISAMRDHIGVEIARPEPALPA